MTYSSALVEQELDCLSLQLSDLITTLARSAVGNPPYDKLDRIFDSFIEGHKITPFCREKNCPPYLIAALIAYVETRKQVETILENDKIVWKQDPGDLSDDEWEVWFRDNWAKGTTGNKRKGISCFKNADSLISYCGFSIQHAYRKGNRSLNVIIRRSKISDVRQFLYYLYQQWSE